MKQLSTNDVRAMGYEVTERKYLHKLCAYKTAELSQPRGCLFTFLVIKTQNYTKFPMRNDFIRW